MHVLIQLPLRESLPSARVDGWTALGRGVMRVTTIYLWVFATGVLSLAAVHLVGNVAGVVVFTVAFFCAPCFNIVFQRWRMSRFVTHKMFSRWATDAVTSFSATGSRQEIVALCGNRYVPSDVLCRTVDRIPWKRSWEEDVFAVRAHVLLHPNTPVQALRHVAAVTTDPQVAWILLHHPQAGDTVRTLVWLRLGLDFAEPAWVNPACLPQRKWNVHLDDMPDTSNRHSV